MNKKGWKYLLMITAEYYRMSEERLLSSSRTNKRAKSTFYWLLFKRGFDLYKVSVELGKKRNTIAMFINNNISKEKNRDKVAEEYLLKKLK